MNVVLIQTVYEYGWSMYYGIGVGQEENWKTTEFFLDFFLGDVKLFDLVACSCAIRGLNPDKGIS